MAHKTYVVDTNILLDDHTVLTDTKDANIILPIQVVQELDNFKTKPGSLGYNARQSLKYLDKLSESGDLTSGVTNAHGCVVAVILVGAANADEAVAYAHTLLDDVICLSNDATVRVLARSGGGLAESRVVDEPTGYTGIHKMSLSQEGFQELQANRGAKFEGPWSPNDLVVAHEEYNPHRKILLTATGNGYLDPLWAHSGMSIFCKINPIGDEQVFASQLLLDKKIPLVSVCGPAGCGKTLLSLGCSLQQIIEETSYKKLVVVRPLVPLGREVGYLPGSELEKLMPWMGPIKDSLDKLMRMDGAKALNDLSFHKKIEIATLQYMRGRSIDNSIILIDEAQNLSAKEIKALITRVGEGSKMILCGDTEQSDLRSSQSGLDEAVEALRHSPLSGHVRLSEGHRSSLATLASNIL